ncbi:unnamed protein product [Onchocerca ochengi]|uniref:Transmembrane protein 107 n=1 Tax=Onchocerca ochengi TaxID=42157 RepID=A0A182E061_ONCOC|nr:unnamed protein product [Onchocerca ochengi]
MEIWNSLHLCIHFDSIWLIMSEKLSRGTFESQTWAYDISIVLLSEVMVYYGKSIALVMMLAHGYTSALLFAIPKCFIKIDALNGLLTKVTCNCYEICYIHHCGSHTSFEF